MLLYYIVYHPCLAIIMNFLIQILELGIWLALISVSNIFINFRLRVEKFSYFSINGFVV